MSVRCMRDPIMLAWNWSLTSELYFRLMENCGKTAPTKKIGPIWQKSLSSCNFSFDTISQILDFYISIVTVKDGISIFLNRWPIMARTFSSNDWQIKVESEFHEISLFPWKKTKKSRLLLLLLLFLQKHGSIFDIKSGWVEVGAAENGKKSWVKGTCSYWLFCFFSFFLFLNAILPAFNQWFQSMVLSPSIFYFFLSVCFSFFSHSVFWCGKWRKKTAF